MIKSFFFKVSFVSYVFLYADFLRNSQKIWHEKCLLIFIFVVNTFLYTV